MTPVFLHNLVPSVARWALAMGMVGLVLGCGADPYATSAPLPAPAIMTAAPVPSPAPVSPTIEAMGTGFGHACALRSGAVWCWGRQSVGVPNPSHAFLTPTHVDLEEVADLTVHRSRTCAVLRDGTVRCWGMIAGDAYDEPIVVEGAENVRAVHFDDRGICVLKRDAQVRCQHDAAWIALGLPPMRSISAERDGFCGLSVDGAAYRWTVASRSVSKVDELAPGATAVACGMGHTICAVYPGGKARCVGEPPPHATRQLPMHDVQQLHMTDNNACLRTGDGSLWCWGDTRLVGLEDTADHHQSDPVRMAVPAFSNFFFGVSNICGIRDDGALSCMGNDEFGQLGRGPYRPRATRVDLPPVREVIEDGCMLLRQNELSCWTGEQEPRETVPATGAATGWWGTCLIHPNGGVRCRDTYGGRGPWVEIVGMRQTKRLRAIGIGREDIAEVFLAISHSGDVYTWGHRMFSPARRLLLGRRFDEVGGQPTITLGLSGDELWAWDTVTHILNSDRHPIAVKPTRIASGVKQLLGACFQAQDDTIHCVRDGGGVPATPIIEPANAQYPNDDYLNLLGRMGRPMPLPDVDGLPPDIVVRHLRCVVTRSGELWQWHSRGQDHPRGTQAVIRF